MQMHYDLSFRDWLDRDSESDVLSLEYIEDFHEGDTIIENLNYI